MSAEFPHPVPEAMRATSDGKYGLKNLPIKNPSTGETCYASTISGYTGPEIKINAPNGESYWNNEGKIAGNTPEGTANVSQEKRDAFTEIVWTI